MRGRKMSKNLEKYTKEDLIKKLVYGNVDVNEINLSKETQRESFKSALKENPNILKRVKDSRAEELIGFAIKEDYKNFLYINLDKYVGGSYLEKEEYIEGWAQNYVINRLADDEKENVNTKDKNEDDLASMITQKSLDGKTLFYYTYVTGKNEEIHFYDNTLQIPLALKTSFKIKLKLKSAIELIKRIDVEVSQIGKNRISSIIEDVLSSNFNGFISSYVNTNKVGYYELCANTSNLEKEFKEIANNGFLKYGIEVNEFIIKKIAIPKDVQNKIEDQAFVIRQRRADIEADNEFAKKSMSLYAEKLALQEKYPNAEHSLTEYEKDLALKRYLIKNDRLKEEEIDRSIVLKQKADKKDNEIQKIKDVIPVEVVKRNKFSIRFWVSLLYGLLASFIALLVDGGVGLIILGVVIATWGTIASLNYKKFKKNNAENGEGGEKEDGTKE